MLFVPEVKGVMHYSLAEVQYYYCQVFSFSLWQRERCPNKLRRYSDETKTRIISITTSIQYLYRYCSFCSWWRLQQG